MKRKKVKKLLTGSCLSMVTPRLCMKKALIYFSFIILSLSFAKAQEKVLLDEKFSNNKNNWRTMQNQDFKVYINDGSLHLNKLEKNSVRNGCLWYRKKVEGLNTLMNFKITYVARFVSGGDSFEAMDWQWGAIDRQRVGVIGDFYQFNLNLSGKARLDYFNNGWARSFNIDINPQLDEIGFDAGKFNEYQIIQEDDTLSFSINGTRVFKQFVTPIKGDYIGIQQCLKSVIALDRIKVSQSLPVALERVASATSSNAQKLLQGSPPDSIAVFPNPFNHALNVAINLAEAGRVQIVLSDIVGRIIYDDQFKGKAGLNQYRLLTNVPPGVYLLRIIRPKEGIIIKKVVRE